MGCTSLKLLAGALGLGLKHKEQMQPSEEQQSRITKSQMSKEITDKYHARLKSDKMFTNDNKDNHY